MLLMRIISLLNDRLTSKLQNCDIWYSLPWTMALSGKGYMHSLLVYNRRVCLSIYSSVLCLSTWLFVYDVNIGIMYTVSRSIIIKYLNTLIA